VQRTHGSAGRPSRSVEREEVGDGRLRRYHRLTEPGAARLAAEAERLRRDAATATARLRLAGGPA